MAVGLTALRAALASQIDTETSGLRCYPRIPGQMQTPAVAVLPAEPYVDRDQSMQRGHVMVRLDVAIVVKLSDIDRGQKQLDDLIDTVTTAVLSDRTVDGNAIDLNIPTVTSPEEGELSGVQVYTALLEVRLIVADS